MAPARMATATIATQSPVPTASIPRRAGRLPAQGPLEPP